MDRRCVIKLPIYAAIAAINDESATAALMPPPYTNCVVAIGYVGPGVQNGIQVPQVWHTGGTGFFYGKLAQNDPDVAKRQYSVFLVTAKHVVKGYEKLQRENPSIGNIKIRVNQLGQQPHATEFDINDIADTDTKWVDNPNGKDVSVIGINLGKLREKQYESSFFTSDTMVANIDKLREIGVNAGDGVFVLGFPMDMAGIQKNYVIVRQGVIARINELLDGASDSLLLDAFVFPGNSGGPVILRPELVSITGTKNNLNAYLIGLVNSFQPYTDVAISPQTGHPRIIFEENSGLSNVSPVDYIDNTIAFAAEHKP